ncbi:MAG: Crp/Fnr family transcriptional regulator [Cyanobacteria bacterium P01_E01_bin.43]
MSSRLRQLPPLASGQAVATESASMTKPQSFRRKHLLPALPDQVWQIDHGIVRTLTWNTQGHVTTLSIWGRGGMVGLPLTRQQPYQMECLTTVKARATPIGSHSRFWQSALLKHLWQQEELLRIVHQPSVRERLTQLLYWLAHRFGRPVSQGQLLESMLTHQQIAEILGTSRVTVTRLLTQLEQEGQLIKFNKSAGQWTGNASLAFSYRALLLVSPP